MSPPMRLGPPVAVLVAAESPAAAEQFRAFLRRMGATVEFFASGGPAALAAEAVRHEAVLVALPGEAGLAAAEAVAALGKALYLDMPAPPGRAAMDQLVGSAAALGLVVEVGWRFRLHPTFRMLEALVEGEDDGRVEGLAVRISGPAAETGALSLLGEGLALARALLGTPTVLSAQEVAGGLRRAITLAWPADMLGIVEVDAASPITDTTVEVRREGAVYRWSCARGRLWRADGDGEAPLADPPLGWDPALLLPQHLAHWLARITDAGRRAAVPLEDALDVADLLAAASEAAATGTRVRLVPAAA